MKFLKKAPFLLCAALAFLPIRIKAESNISLFPEMPIYRTILTDSNALNTGISVPRGLEKEVANKPLKELLPYTSLSKEIPILSLDIKSKKVPDFIPLEKRIEVRSRNVKEGINLSDKIFSASLITSGKLNFREDKISKYTARTELVFGSPMIDDYLSDGNRLFFATGANFEGSLNLNGIENRSLSSLLGAFNPESHNFFGNMYISVKSPYSSQVVLFKAGFDNLFGNNKDPANLNLYTAFELPPIVSSANELKNSKIIPYISAGIEYSLGSFKNKASGELGIKVTGDSKKAILGYIHAELEIDKGASFYSGLKFDL